MHTNDITAEYVRSRLNYNPDTGIWTWKKCPTMPMEWNSRFAGKVAGGLDTRGYTLISIDSKRYRSARLVFLYMTGEHAPQMIDHINLNRADDRWANLRKATPQQNCWNSAPRPSNTTGYKGVVLLKRNKKKWCARLCSNGKTLYVGVFDDPQIAHAAYLEAARKYHGEFAYQG